MQKRMLTPREEEVVQALLMKHDIARNQLFDLCNEG
jgi:hypothetical protein